jgi:competence protein ComEC
MWMLALIALQLGRRAYVWVSLTVVAAAMSWWNPDLLWDNGFQLSVVGTAGIVAFTPWFDRRLHRLPAVLRESTAVTLAAQLATAPITAVGFGQLSLAGPLANGLLLPLLGPIMALGGLAAIVAAFVPVAGHILAFVVYPLLALFIGAVQTLARMPLAAVAPPSVPLAAGLCYYLLLVVLARRHASFGLDSAIAVPRIGALARAAPRGLVAGCLFASITASIALSRPTGQTRLLIAGTGSDTAALLLTSAGRVAVFDGGQDPAKLQALLGAHLPV